MLKPIPGMFRRGLRWYFKFKTDSGQWREYATGTTDLAEAIGIRSRLLPALQKGLDPNDHLPALGYSKSDEQIAVNSQNTAAAPDMSALPALFLHFLGALSTAFVPYDRPGLTFGQAVEEWREQRRYLVKRTTFASEISIAGTFRREFGDSTTLLNVAKIDVIRRYQTTRLQCGISPKTVNNEIVVLASILEKANLWHRIAAHYKPLRVEKSDVGAALTPEECIRFLETALASDPNAASPYGALLSFSTGMRLGETQQMRIGSIHLHATNPFVHVKRATTKTNGGARYVALDRMARYAIDKLLARAERLGATKPEHYLFPTLLQKHTRRADPLHGGKGYDPTHHQTSWGDEWTALRKRAGITHIRFHDLRHTYITRAAEAGVPLAVTKAQVGHMSAQMVEHYTHICDKAIHHAARRIEENSAELFTLLGRAGGTEITNSD